MIEVTHFIITRYHNLRIDHEVLQRAYADDNAKLGGPELVSAIRELEMALRIDHRY